jgi:hypothetical protein
MGAIAILKYREQEKTLPKLAGFKKNQNILNFCF